MPQKRKRVSQRVLRRRRMTALAIFVGILLLGIIIIAVSCSKDDSDEDVNGNSTPVNTSIVTNPANNNPITSTTTTTAQLTVIGTDEFGQTITSIVTTSSDVIGTATVTGDGEKVEKIELTFYSCNLEVGETQMPYVTMYPESLPYEEKGEIWESSDTSIATVDDIGNITGLKAGTCYVTVTSVNNPEVFAQVKVTVKGSNVLNSTESTNLSNSPEAESSNSVSEPTYIQGILIANKSYALPSDYNPGLDPTTESQFNTLVSAASQEGLNIYLSSGFRSYETQNRIYNNYVDSYGKSSADTFSARPGHSEHQTGLAIDVNTIDDSFAGTPEAIWLEQHAHEYGFIIRYPQGKEHITGYKYEPWHLRYLGVETATSVYNSGLTLEEYLGIDSVYSN